MGQSAHGLLYHSRIDASRGVHRLVVEREAQTVRAARERLRRGGIPGAEARRERHGIVAAEVLGEALQQPHRVARAPSEQQGEPRDGPVVAIRRRREAGPREAQRL